MADQDPSSTLREALDRIEVRNPSLSIVIAATESAALMALAVAEHDRADDDERFYAAHACLELSSLLKRFRADVGRPVDNR